MQPPGSSTFQFSMPARSKTKSFGDAIPDFLRRDLQDFVKISQVTHPKTSCRKSSVTSCVQQSYGHFSSLDSLYSNSIHSVSTKPTTLRSSFKLVHVCYMVAPWLCSPNKFEFKYSISTLLPQIQRLELGDATNIMPRDDRVSRTSLTGRVLSECPLSSAFLDQVVSEKDLT